MPHATASLKLTGLPPLLVNLIRAVSRDTRQRERIAAGRAAALSELAHLFSLIVPVRGIEPGDDVRTSIERIAERHLRRGEAEAQLRRAIDRIASVKDRDAIESACIEVVEVGELAHYYAGVAAGITLAELARRST